MHAPFSLDQLKIPLYDTRILNSCVQPFLEMYASKVCAQEFVDEARGETSLERRLRRGELALVTTVRLDISYNDGK